MITKFGYDVFFTVLAICSVVIILALLFVEPKSYKFIIIIFSIIIFCFTAFFFRDPERIIPNGDNLITSPADGKVIVVKKVQETEFLNAEVWQVSIFMSPLNVHVNRNPITGTVKYKKYRQGKFKIAFADDASIENEQMSIGLEGKYGKVLFIQIAGFIARRIVCTLNKDDEVKMGTRMGMIKFGSRLDVFFPTSANVKVKVGDITKAGETVIAEFPMTMENEKR